MSSFYVVTEKNTIRYSILAAVGVKYDKNKLTGKIIKLRIN